MHALEPGVFAGPQPSLAELRVLADHGVKTVINNRPDHEEPGQPTSAQMQAAAQQLGMAYLHAPIGGGQAVEQSVAAVRDALKKLPRPAYMFCRSGMRSMTAYAQAVRG